jgi:hypothetical protein
MLPSVESTTSRFSLVGYIPSYAAVLYLLVIFAGGAPAHAFDVGRAADRIDGLGAAGLVGLAVVVLMISVVLQPLQLSIVRLLEGYWPSWLRRVNRFGVKRQHRELARLLAASASKRENDPTDNRTVESIQAAAWERVRRFAPEPVPLLPTALGNALRAMESRAGQRYGADTVTWWPRLYPLLGDAVRGVVDDRRNQLDMAARLCATAVVVGVVSIPLLATSGWWLAVSVVPLALAYVCYRGALSSAIAYGEAMASAFDLHRFDLLAALHLALPANPADESALNTRLTRFWLQNVPLTDLQYRHDDHG